MWELSTPPRPVRLFVLRVSVSIGTTSVFRPSSLSAIPLFLASLYPSQPKTALTLALIFFFFKMAFLSYCFVFFIIILIIIIITIIVKCIWRIKTFMCRTITIPL